MPASPPVGLTILDLINLVGKFGGNLPAVLTFIESVATAWKVLQDAINAANPAPAQLTAVSLTDDEMAACDSLHDTHLKLGSGQTLGAFDGHRIANLMNFIKSNPQLLQTIGTLLPAILAMFGKPAA